jgi:hypothetical protein
MTRVKTADIQVVDLLGKIIASAKANTTWKWNASDVMNGSYSPLSAASYCQSFRTLKSEKLFTLVAV